MTTKFLKVRPAVIAMLRGKLNAARNRIKELEAAQQGAADLFKEDTLDDSNHIRL